MIRETNEVFILKEGIFSRRKIKETGKLKILKVILDDGTCSRGSETGRSRCVMGPTVMAWPGTAV